jgi:hypothetical protein
MNKDWTGGLITSVIFGQINHVGARADFQSFVDVIRFGKVWDKIIQSSRASGLACETIREKMKI